MKTSPMLMITIGALLSGSLLAQPWSPSSDWQSLKIDETVEPVFPFGPMQQGLTEGVVRIAISTDASGKLEEWLVIEYSRKEFADAAVAAIKEWKFEPARLHGRPVGTIAELNFHFEARGVVISSASAGDQVEALINRIMRGRLAFRPCSLNELDRIPVPTVTVAPRYPETLAKQGARGRVTIEFFIDETGAVRMPSASAEDNTALTALAINALSQWKFTPPTARGRGVLVKASQEFVFDHGS